MRIAQLAPPYETVPPHAYGGTEQVVATITRELVRRGHDVTLFASGDSYTSARLVPIVDQALWHDPTYRDCAPFCALALGKLERELEQFDLVHNHLDYLTFPLARRASCPILTTMHGRLDLPELRPLYAEFTDVPLVSISDAQRRPVPCANWAATIYHGLDIEGFTFQAHSEGYLAFLGRICPDKGLDTAIRVAQRVGMPLRIAARLPLRLVDDPIVREDWAYYGVTGFVCDDEDGLVRAVDRIGTVDRARCRQEAEQRFTAAAMVTAYEKVYAQLRDEAMIGAPLVRSAYGRCRR